MTRNGEFNATGTCQPGIARASGTAHISRCRPLTEIVFLFHPSFENSQQQFWVYQWLNTDFIRTSTAGPIWEPKEDLLLVLQENVTPVRYTGKRIADGTTRSRGYVLAIINREVVEPKVNLDSL